jgi:hypothetical protein
MCVLLIELDSNRTIQEYRIAKMNNDKYIF